MKLRPILLDFRTSVVIFAILIFIAFSWFSSYFTSYKVTPKPFNSVAWKNQTIERVAMYEDLIATHKLIGMSKADVIALLGQPNSSSIERSKFKLKDRKGRVEYITYSMGSDNFRTSNSLLSLELENDVVVAFSRNDIPD